MRNIFQLCHISFAVAFVDNQIHHIFNILGICFLRFPLISSFFQRGTKIRQHPRAYNSTNECVTLNLTAVTHSSAYISFRSQLRVQINATNDAVTNKLHNDISYYLLSFKINTRPTKMTCRKKPTIQNHIFDISDNMIDCHSSTK